METMTEVHCGRNAFSIKRWVCTPNPFSLFGKTLVLYWKAFWTARELGLERIEICDLVYQRSLAKRVKACIGKKRFKKLVMKRLGLRPRLVSQETAALGQFYEARFLSVALDIGEKKKKRKGEGDFPRFPLTFCILNSCHPPLLSLFSLTQVFWDWFQLA